MPSYIRSCQRIFNEGCKCRTEISFKDSSGEKTSLSWPPGPCYSADTALSSLGRQVSRFLTERGVTVTKGSDSSRKYYCNADIAVHNDTEKFIINLQLVYCEKAHLAESSLPHLHISREELTDHLKVTLAFGKEKDLLESKVKSLLTLSTVKCFINGLELELGDDY